MAAIASETVTITINDVEIAVPKGELIVESVKRLGLEIPIFCYHPRMKPVGMCRMCLVEVGFKQPDGSVRKMPKPQAGCTLPASDGMVIFTDSELVHRDRKGVLEFLLINHPLDCPICDRGGECPLQNNTIFYGPSTSRFIELKRHAHKAFPLSKHVTLDLERCIQCGRCVRFTEEISGDSELAFRFRGSDMQPSTFELRDFTSKFSGNVIEICPVGALTNREYRFRARPWDLETKGSVCTECSNGCNVWFDYRVGKLVRVNGRTNEAVNEEWTCDRGKFGSDWMNDAKRLTKPLLRAGDRLEETDWPKAYAEILRAFGGSRSGLLVGPRLSLEAMWLTRELFVDHFGSKNIDSRWTRHLLAPGEAGYGASAKTAIAAYDTKPTIFVFGTSLADEQPILFLRVRKAWFLNAAKVIVASDQETDVDSFAHLVLRYKPGTEAVLARALAGEDVEGAATETGVPADRIREAASLLGAGVPIVTSVSLFERETGVEAHAALSKLAQAKGAEFNCYASGANEQGALELGLVEDGQSLDTYAMLQAAAKGELDALWLAGCDPFSLCADRGLVQAALENVPFLVVQDSLQTESFGYASVVLPMAAPAEQDGSYVNMERRVQRILPVLNAPGEAKPGWKIAAEALMRSAPTRPVFSAEEVFAKLSASKAAFVGLSYNDLAGEGVLLG